MGDILIRKQDCCNKENTLISQIPVSISKSNRKKVFFYRVFYGNQKEAESLEGKLNKQGEMIMRVWQETISLVNNFQETLIKRYSYCCLFVFGICFVLGVNLLQEPVAR